MNQPFKFNKLPSNLTYFNKLPYDLHRYIYGFIYTAVINSIFHDYNWFEIFEFIGYSYSYEYLIEKINHLLPNKTNKFLITNSDMYSVGFYEEKVKASIWGRRYIWIEDCINEENTINLLIEKIDDYVRSIDYNEEVLFKMNKIISLLVKEIIEDKESFDNNPYIIKLSNEMNKLITYVK